jgi:hypothetical protein
MNRLLILFIPLLICLVPACVPTPEEYVELETREINVSGSRSILVQVDYGEVSILQSSDDRVTVEGQVLFDEALEYLIDATEDQILIKAYARHRGFSKVPLKMIVRLPPQMQVKVETDNASVSVQDFQGKRLLFRRSWGKLYFSGSILMDDDVRLETDHGAVSVHLKADSALDLQVRSTSGDVTCLVPGHDFNHADVRWDNEYGRWRPFDTDGQRRCDSAIDSLIERIVSAISSD